MEAPSTTSTKPKEILLRLPQVLARVPVARSTWWDGVKTGKFPRPVKLGQRITCWRQSDIDLLVERLG